MVKVHWFSSWEKDTEIIATLADALLFVAEFDHTKAAEVTADDGTSLAYRQPYCCRTEITHDGATWLAREVHSLSKGIDEQTRDTLLSAESNLRYVIDALEVR